MNKKTLFIKIYNYKIDLIYGKTSPIFELAQRSLDR